MALGALSFEDGVIVGGGEFFRELDVHRFGVSRSEKVWMTEKSIRLYMCIYSVD